MMIRRFKYDALWGALLLLLPLLLFAPVTLGRQTLLPGDALYLFEPYRSLRDTAPTPQNPLLSDLVLENYPWKRFLVNSVQARELPLWDPYLFGGHPFLANGQHSALYPLTWLSLLLPLPRAFGVFMTLQLGLAGISMYLLGRTLHANHLGAFLAGVVFQLSGFLVISAVHPMIVAAASWLPLLLALVDLTVRRAPFFGTQRAMLPWALLGAIALGLEILAGHAEITYFTLLVMGMFAAWRLAHTALTQPRATWRSDVLSPAIGLLLMVGLGLTLGAVQLLPLYEVVQTSFRQGAVTLSDVLGWAYPTRRLITFLVPNFFGNPTHRALHDVFTGATLPTPTGAFDWGIKNYVEGAAYLGILPLFLAAIAILRPPKTRISGSADRRISEKAEKRVNGSALSPQSSVLSTQHSALSTSYKIKQWLSHPYVPFFTFLSLFSLGCIFGTPMYALVYALPFLNQSHSPFRWVFPLTVALAALAALGATTVTNYRRTHGPEGERGREGEGETQITNDELRMTKHIPRWLMVNTSPNAVSFVAVAALWMGLLLLAGLWLSRLLFGPIEPLVARVFLALARAPETFPDHRAFYSYLFPWIQTAALLLIGAGCVLRVSRCPIYLPRRLGRRPVWEVMAVALLVLDLVSFSAGFNPATDPALLTAEPPSIAFLKQQPGLWRFSTFAPHG
ncbi:MAG TPA: hypothetical protein PKH77_27790, partial [Anaerolineae bacterium]|nr:hypothetical protein [Anaerolineae bacterium]